MEVEFFNMRKINKQIFDKKSKKQKWINKVLKFNSIKFRDSYAMISKKLSLFPEMFELEGEKELYAYELPYITYSNQKYMLIKDYLKQLIKEKM